MKRNPQNRSCLETPQEAQGIIKVLPNDMAPLSWPLVAIATHAQRSRRNNCAGLGTRNLPLENMFELIVVRSTRKWNENAHLSGPVDAKPEECVRSYSVRFHGEGYSVSSLD